MKKLLLTLVICYQSVSASTWFEYAKSPKQSYQYEHTMITHHDNQGLVLVIWTRIIQNDIVRKTTKNELHCPSKAMRHIVEVTTDASGDNVIQTFDPNPQWYYALPDSPDMALLDWACKNYW
jgi:hypothetical protein